MKNVHADDSVRLETEPTGPGEKDLCVNYLVFLSLYEIKVCLSSEIE